MLAYFYFKEAPGRRSAANLPTKDEARQLSVNFPTPPKLLGGWRSNKKRVEMRGLAARELGQSHWCCSLATSLTCYMCMPSGSCKTARKDENAGGERCTDCSAAKKSDELPPPHWLAPAPRPTPQHFRWARAVPYTSKLVGSLMSEMGRVSRVPSEFDGAHVREMEVGPPGSAIRCRSQATASCCRQKRWW